MRNKILLKNKGKYKTLKLAKGIDIKHLKKIKRYNYTEGISTIGYGDTWFVTKYGKGLFKSYKHYDFNVSKDLRIISELLYNEVAKQVGVKVAEYKPANINKDVGLISIDVAKNGEKLIELSELFGKDLVIDNFETFYRALSVYRVDYNFNEKEIYFDLFKMMILDELTFQEDRHNSNIHFLLTKDNTIKLSPIIDNEFAFGVKTINKFHNFGSEQMRTQDFLKTHAGYMMFPVYDRTTYLSTDVRYKENLKHLLQMSYGRKEYEEFVIKCLNNINIESAINNVEQLGYKISADYKKYLKDITDLSKQIFVSTIKETKQIHPQCFDYDVEEILW